MLGDLCMVKSPFCITIWDTNLLGTCFKHQTCTSKKLNKLFVTKPYVNSTKQRSCGTWVGENIEFIPLLFPRIATKNTTFSDDMKIYYQHFSQIPIKPSFFNVKPLICHGGMHPGLVYIDLRCVCESLGEGLMSFHSHTMLQ